MQHHRLSRIARVLVATETYRKIERHTAMERHRCGDVVDLEFDPWAPITNQHIRVHQWRLDVLRQGRALWLGQVRHDVRDNHVEAGEHDVLGLDPVRRSGADVADEDNAAGLTHVDAGRIQADANVLAAAIESVVVERGENEIVHRVTRRDTWHEGAYQQTGERGAACGEV